MPAGQKPNFTIPIKCCICGQTLHGQYVTNLFGDVYCARHGNAYPSCYSCGRPIASGTTGGGARYADGREVCAVCRKTAVDSESAALSILREVRQTLAKIGLDVNHPEIQPKLAGRETLLRLAAERGFDLVSLEGITETIKYTDGKRQIGFIYILDGLPRQHTAAIMAHEIGHAWLFLHEFPILSLMTEEGICELWAARWLEMQNTPLAKHRLQIMAKNPDPVYGDGYRAALKALRGRTVPGLLERVRRGHGFF